MLEPFLPFESLILWPLTILPALVIAALRVRVRDFFKRFVPFALSRGLCECGLKLPVDCVFFADAYFKTKSFSWDLRSLSTSLRSLMILFSWRRTSSFYISLRASSFYWIMRRLLSR
jgi:hypothetical protein